MSKKPKSRVRVTAVEEHVEPDVQKVARAYVWLARLGRAKQGRAPVDASGDPSPSDSPDELPDQSPEDAS